MNYSEKIKEQLSCIKDRSPEFYKNIEAVEWSDKQRWFDKWFIQAIEQVLPVLEWLEKDKIEVSVRCEEYAKTLDGISFSL